MLETRLKDLILKIFCIAMDLLLNSPPTLHSFQATGAITNTSSLLISMLGVLSLWEAKALTLTLLWRSRPKVTIMNISMTSWRLVTTGSGEQPTATSSATLTLSTWLRKSRSLRKKKTIPTSVANIVNMCLFRNCVQKWLCQERKPFVSF